MRTLIDIIILTLLGGVVYYFGYVLGAAYDNTNDYKDILAVGCSLGFLTYVWYRWA
jgi:uncharacterized membrane protein